MRAVWYEATGAADEVLQCGDMEIPEPGPGEVRVKLATSGVNPVDTKRRLGGRGPMDAPRVVPHFDGAGIIDAVGDGVDGHHIGQRVWVYDAQWQRPGGTAAEFTTVPAVCAVALPDRTSFAEGACLGIPALTAHGCLFGDGSVAGKTVLVTGGAGAVGRYAVQFAKLGGATVIATVSGDDKAIPAKAAGADHVINYKTDDVAARINASLGGGGVDRIVEVEFGGNLPTSLKALNVGGTIAAYASDAVREPVVPFYPLAYKQISLRQVLVFLLSDAAKAQAVDDITRWMAAGQLSHHIGPRFALEDAAAAHQVVEGHAVGKVLLDIATLD
ncbi:MAG: NADPH:quinone reductase [Alphaproteobacteria bacterium]